METEKKLLEEEDEEEGLLDIVLRKVTSRKLMVWGFSVYLLLMGKLESEHFVWLSLVYIGSEAAIDFVSTLKGK